MILSHTTRQQTQFKSMWLAYIHRQVHNVIDMQSTLLK